MKTFTSLLISGLFVAATVQALAAFESLQIESTETPFIPADLQQITDARVIVVVNVSADGRITDHLVVGYSHERLVRPVVEALRSWNYTPARLDGQAVPAQVCVTLEFDRTGMVVSCIGMELTEYFINSIMGKRLAYRLYGPRELDRPPVGINLASPKYAKAAADQGVHGTVKVRFYIDETGQTRMPSVESAAHPYLSEIAVAAVREWKFEPTTVRGKPAMIEAAQEFVFRADP